MDHNKSADRSSMFEQRALPSTLTGLAALAFAVTSMVTQQEWLVVLAAVLVLTCVVLVLTLPEHRAMRQPENSDLASKAERALRESDAMAARAAKYEAEAIAAREQLASAMASGQEAAVIDLTVPTPADLTTAPTGVDVIDPSTGVFTQMFFEASLAKRVSAARRGLRPLAVGVVEVIEHIGTSQQHKVAPQTVATVLTSTLREADTIAILNTGNFAILLEDTPENGAIWSLERIRRKIDEEMQDTVMHAGVSCYPSYALDADQLFDQAVAALESARDWRQHRIEITTAHPDE